MIQHAFFFPTLSEENIFYIRHKFTKHHSVSVEVEVLNSADMKITMSGEDANNMIEAAFALGVFMEKNK